MLKAITNTERSNFPLDYTLQGDLIYYRTVKEHVSTVFSYNYKTYERKELFKLDDKIYFLRSQGQKLFIFTSSSKLYIYENKRLSTTSILYDDFTFFSFFDKSNKKLAPFKNKKQDKSGLFDVENMRVLWENNGKNLGIIRDNMFFSLDNKTCRRLNISSGDIMWEVEAERIHTVSSIYPIKTGKWFFMIVATTDDAIILSTQKPMLCSINKNTGKINWMSDTITQKHSYNKHHIFPVSPRSFAVTPDKKELVTIHNGIYSAIDIETGRHNEMMRVMSVREKSNENAHGGTGLTKCWKNKVIFHGGRGICVFDRDKKEIIETHLLPEGEITNSVSTAQIHNGHYMLNSISGRVFVFELTDE
jgi:hypothetical protein